MKELFLENLSNFFNAPALENRLDYLLNALKNLQAELNCPFSTLAYFEKGQTLGMRVSLFENEVFKKEIVPYVSTSIENWISTMNREFREYLQQKNFPEHIFDLLLDSSRSAMLLLAGTESEVKRTAIITKIQSWNPWFPICYRLLAEKEKQATKNQMTNFKVILDSLNDGICQLDKQANIFYVNPAFEKLSGYKLEEIFGKPGIMLHHPIDHPRLKATLRKRADASEESSSAVYHLQRKDGQVTEVYISGVITRDEDGLINGSVGVFVEASHIAKLEAEMKKTKDFLEKLLENISEGVITLTMSGNIQYINSVARKLLEINSKDINEPINFQELLSTANKDIFQNILKNLFHQDRYAKIMKLKTSTGAEIPSQIVFSAATDASKEIHFIVGIIRDLSSTYALIQQTVILRAHLLESENATLSITRFGTRGTEILYSDPLHFGKEDDMTTLEQNTAIYFQALGQVKVEAKTGQMVYNEGTFGPLPVPKHPDESAYVFLGNMQADQVSDHRFKKNGVEPYLISLIFPKNAENLFNREDINHAIRSSLENILKFTDFTADFVHKLRLEIANSTIGLKSSLEINSEDEFQE